MASSERVAARGTGCSQPESAGDTGCQQPAPHGRRSWLATLAGLLGAAAVIGQSLYVREILVAFFGNELSLGVVLAAWLLGVATGAGVGGAVAKRTGRPVAWLVAAALIATITLPGGLFLARTLRLIAQAPAGSLLPFRWLVAGAALVTIPFSLLIGFTFPLASRAARVRPGAPTGGIALIYVSEATGAVAGGLLFSFALVGRFGAFRIGLWMAALVAMAAAWPAVRTGRAGGLWRPRQGGAPAPGGASKTPEGARATWHTRGRVCHMVLGALPAVAVVAVAALAAGPLDRLSARLRWQGIAPRQTLVAAADSPYGTIALGRWEDQFNLYLDGHFASAFPDPRSFSHTAHLALCQHPDPKRVLLIGGGMEGLLRPILRHPLEVLHYVELDPALLRVLYDHIDTEDRAALADPRLTVFATDGRLFVERLARGDYALLADLAVDPSAGWTRATGEPRARAAASLEAVRRRGYDLVMLTVPPPSNAGLNRFYTKEFLRAALRSGSGREVLAMSLPTTGPNYRGLDALNYVGSFYHSVRDLGLEVVVRPDEATLWFFASRERDTVTADPALLARRYAERGISDPYFHPVVFRGDFPPQRVEALERDLMSRADVPRNTDDRPVTYFYDTILWGRYSGSGAIGDVRAALETAWTVALVGMFGAVIVLNLAARVGGVSWYPRGLRFAAVWTVATVGFAAMALELMLLFAYQNLFGVVYQRIGAAVGLFMGGLALGGLFSRWLLGRRWLEARKATWLDWLSWVPAALEWPWSRSRAGPREGESPAVSATRRIAVVARIVAVALFALTMGAAALFSGGVLGREGIGGFLTDEAGLMLLLTLAGLLTGAMFPLASRLCLLAGEVDAGASRGAARGAQVARTAAVLDAADHGGACLGALLTGVLLVPLLGTTQTAWLAGVLVLTGYTLLLLSRPR